MSGLQKSSVVRPRLFPRIICLFQVAFKLRLIKFRLAGTLQIDKRILKAIYN